MASIWALPAIRYYYVEVSSIFFIIGEKYMDAPPFILNIIIVCISNKIIAFNLDITNTRIPILIGNCLKALESLSWQYSQYPDLIFFNHIIHGSWICGLKPQKSRIYVALVVYITIVIKSERRWGICWWHNWNKYGFDIGDRINIRTTLK